MKLTIKSLALPCLVACFVIGWAVRGHNDVAAQQAAPAAQAGAAAAARPPFIITEMYTGSDGLTHLRDKALPPGELEKAAAVTVSRISANPARPSDWHNAPWRRYVVPMSGRFEVEVSSDGTIKSFGPGDILLAADVAGKGHKTRAVGGKDCVWMFVELDQPKPANPAGAAGRGSAQD